MNIPRQTTRISDKDGGVHEYSHAPFPYDECLDLGLEIAAVVGGPLGDALQTLLLGGDLDDGALDSSVLTKAAAGIGDVPARLIARGGAQLVARILATTTRVGQDDGGPVRQHLADPDVRTAAYSAGNLMESIQAVRWVLQVNYGPFLTALWDALLPRLSELAPQSTSPETAETESNGLPSNDLKPSETVSSIG